MTSPYAAPVQALIDELGRLPGVGPKSAQRIAYYLLKAAPEDANRLARVIMEAFIAGQEPDKDCSGATVEVSKLPYYLQRAFYQPKESEPTQSTPDATAQSGESAESPAPDVQTPATTTTTTSTQPPPM